MKRLLLLLALLPLYSLLHAEDDLLDPDKAFALDAGAVDASTIRLTWTIADGYYLYHSKFKVTSDTAGVTLGEPKIPAGKVKHDEFFGDVEIFRHKVTIDVPVKRSEPGKPLTLTLTAHSQGCADVGVCYPPQRQTRTVQLAAAAASKPKPVQSLSALSSDLGLVANDDDILDPDQAFKFTTTVVDSNTLLAHWEIAPHHYLYRDKFTFAVQGAGVSLGPVTLPAGEVKNDEFFGKMEIYHNAVEVPLPLIRASGDATEVTLKVSYQGCAEAGICYPPQNRTTTLSVPAGGALGSAAAPASSTGDTTVSEQDSLAQSLASGNTFATIALFFGLGLLLAFTPCVFPMIPILSSIIVGQGEALTTRKAFVLSVTYVLAMALTYTVAGIIAGLFGANLQAAFQNPWILGSFAAVFVALSFSMFGFFELQLPSALQSKLTEVSNKQEGGTLAGVAIMGLLSALIVGPCVAPPLMGALIYIGQTGDAVLGGLALFALSLGMGAPLVVIGTAGGKVLPRAGGWMDAVKAVFGVLLLAVAIWMLERILPAAITLLLWALLLIISAVYMGAVDAIREGASGWKKLWKGIGLVLLLQGALMLIGLAAGNSDPLQPLRGIGGGSGGVAQAEHLNFKSIKSVADLEREVEAASAQGRPVMVDFYADWCVSCKEFEKYTFSDPAVIAGLAGFVLLQADVTANDAQDQALLKRFKLIGPPALIFFDRDGNELSNRRLVGFLEAEPFRAHVDQILARK